METIEELKRNEHAASEVERCFDTALEQLKNLPLSRETALARTKIEEAGMWLGRYQRSVTLELARRLC